VDRFRSPPKAAAEIATDDVVVVVLQPVMRMWPGSLDRLPDERLVLHAVKVAPVGADVVFQVAEGAI
jgi:hypothetical protein